MFRESPGLLCGSRDSNYPREPQLNELYLDQDWNTIINRLSIVFFSNIMILLVFFKQPQCSLKAQKFNLVLRSKFNLFLVLMHEGDWKQVRFFVRKKH